MRAEEKERINQASRGEFEPVRDAGSGDVHIEDLMTPEEAAEDEKAYERLDHAPLAEMPSTSFGVGDNPGDPDIEGTRSRADLNTDAGIPNDGNTDARK